MGKKHNDAGFTFGGQMCDFPPPPDRADRGGAEAAADRPSEPTEAEPRPPPTDRADRGGAEAAAVAAARPTPTICTNRSRVRGGSGSRERQRRVLV